ncbi:MAG TPA: PspC domain-containing protein [Candidatus Paceibacterota bacterium]
MTMRALGRIHANSWSIDYNRVSLRSGGVCAGIAYWLGIRTWIVRLAVFLFVLFGSGIGIFIYLTLWIFLPKWEKTPEDYEEISG